MSEVIIIDMHWRFTAHEAIKIIDQMDAYNLYVAEAPCAPEDIEGQAQVAASVPVSIAIGEELRTRYEFLPRLTNPVIYE
jgi:galactonate dehydratase